MDSRKGIVAMTLSMASFIVNDALIKLVGEHMATIQVVFIRGLCAAVLVFAGILIWQPASLRTVAGHAGRLVYCRAAIDALSTFGYLWALFHLPLPDITAINMSAPLTVTALAVIFLGERVAWRRWTAILAGFVGVLFVIQPTGQGFNWFSVVALMATLLHATRDLMTRFIAGEVPSIVVTLATAVVVTVMAGVALLGTGWQPVSTIDLALLVGAAVFLIGGYHFIIVAMRSGEASVVAPFRYTAILWSLILGYGVWGDVPNLHASVGIIMLVGSGLYMIRREARLRRRQET
ncbi:MAG TPA: DMT family transporter [Alphaproteobacteria bacterium]|nr:DMT family transporter [Alphaproteobacteria bacterium]